MHVIIPYVDLLKRYNVPGKPFHNTMSPTGSILILGATGASGLAFIQFALSQANPPSLTLYVRSRAKLPVGIEKKARIVEGNLTDERALLDALEGVDTVVSLLGAYVTFSAFILRTTSTVFKLLPFFRL